MTTLRLPRLLQMPRFMRFGIRIDTAPEWLWLMLLAAAGCLVFGLFEGAASADRAAVVMRAPGHRVVRTATLGRRAYLRSQAGRGAP